MKQIFYLLLIAIIFSSCAKDSIEKYEIEKSFADPSIKLDDLKKQLSTGTDGYKMTIESINGGYYGGYIKFDGTSSAKFLLDNSTVNSTTPLDTKYGISIRQTNSVLSLGSTSSFALLAKSLGGIDSTFTYKSVSGDTLRLTGDVLGSKITLIKSSKADADEYLAGKMVNTATAFNSLNTFKLYFKRLIVGTKTYDLIINPKYKYITFNYLNGTTFQRFITPFAYTNNGISLKFPFLDGTTNINSVSNLAIDLVANTATLKAGSTSATITNAAAPLTFDPSAAAKFYANGNTLVAATGTSYSWLSYTGFTVNGVKDYFGVTTITGLNYLSFTPRYNASYDRLGFIVNGAIAAYGPAIPTSIKTNGTIAFTYLGTFGTTPTAYTNIVNNTRIQLCDALGYYVIQTGAAQYDFVNIKDGTTWISWE